MNLPGKNDRAPPNGRATLWLRKGVSKPIRRGASAISIDSRFLEPACDAGNFLTEILRRKLRVVEDRYQKSRLEYERCAVPAVSCGYGIHLLEDNVQECRGNLFDIAKQAYARLNKDTAKDAFLDPGVPGAAPGSSTPRRRGRTPS